ncbi:MAG: hypothetical protein Q8Q09_28745 [Deltaproteobacteria bacterium]|nr:hypothetical protein [Deltaproteobacteria bacterium]
MADEKKPNLKDRLKKTQVGMQNPASSPVGPPLAGPPGLENQDIAPPFGVTPPTGQGLPAPAFGMGGIPGLSNEVAPPAFVQEQQAAAKAAAAARKVADDPFGASTAVAHPQELRIVMDERPVDDSEVGKKRTGTIVAIVVTAIACLGAGFLIGGQSETNSQNRQTLLALNTVRDKAQAAGNTLATVKTKLEAACERANIAGGSEDAPSTAPPSHPPTVDMDLVTWFRESGGETAPFGPEVFAGRMGRLDPQVSQKIAGVHVLFAELWRQLTAHSQAMGNGAAVTESLRSAGDSSAMTLRLGLILKQPQANAPFVGVLALAQNVNVQTGQVTLAALNGVPEPERARAIFTGGQPLAVNQFAGVFFSVNVTDGLGPQLQRASSMAWLQYRQRLTSLKNLVTTLNASHESMMSKINGRPG